ncbi:hypothetical protein AVO46_18715, partial [Vibrio cholerae]
EDFVASSGGAVAADGGSGAPGDRGQACVGGQVPGGGEVFAGDFGEDPCCGPDADRRQRHQDLVKRVGLHEGSDLGIDGGAPLMDPGEHARQFGQDDGRGVRA